MAQKTLREDRTFRFIGGVVGAVWFAVFAMSAFDVPWHGWSRVAVSAAAQLALVVWGGIFLWRWYSGYYRREAPSPPGLQLLRSLWFSVMMWVGLALLLVLLLNYQSSLSLDLHTRDLVLKFGPIGLGVVLFLVLSAISRWKKN